MSNIFLKTLNMSIAASWLILAVLLLRFVLKKAPKWIAVLLWGIAALRLVVPFSFESALSLIPSVETFDIHSIQNGTPAIKSGIHAVNNAVNPILDESFTANPAASVNPLYVWTFVVSVIWLIGIAAMLLYAAVSSIRIRQSVAERVPYRENIFLCDYVNSPFILGLVRPKIYLPSSMDTMTIEPVIAHEKAHLSRRDHWWKPLGFLILSVHWFNPFCWIAYILLCRDIELACDEKVIRQMDLNGKKKYSTALLECSTGRRLVTICPLAFGKIGVKERVKNVLNYKKPTFWVISVALIACVVTAVCFLTNPVSEKTDIPNNDGIENRKLTLNDVIILSQKGDALTWSDFDRYQGQEIGSGLYIMRYEINELFELLVGGVPDETPMYIYLRVNNEADDRIDIRTENVSTFIETHRNDVPEVVEPKPDGGGEPEPEKPDFSAFSDEQSAIRQAIIEHNNSPYSQKCDATCCSFITLATLSDTPPAENGTRKITYYGWALYEEYNVTDNGLETTSGSHIPVALSFDLDESGYTLTEYWEPRDGSYYVQDIREKFPAHIVEDGIDSQKFILQQQQECYVQAVTSIGLDTNQVIETLIKTICSSPSESSNPGDYINEHSIDYRELTFYGQYTLKYCFERFEEGGETGLAGQIMLQVCEDIATGWNEGPLVFNLPADGTLTGQMWYSAFKDNALSLMEQYNETELKEHYPASYVLLSMLGKV